MKLTLFVLLLSLGIAAVASANQHYLCKRSGADKTGPAQFDLRRWDELLRIKVDAKPEEIAFIGIYKPSEQRTKGFYRFREFTNRSNFRAIQVNGGVYTDRPSGNVRLEVPQGSTSKLVDYSCSTL